MNEWENEKQTLPGGMVGACAGGEEKEEEGNEKGKGKEKVGKMCDGEAAREKDCGEETGDRASRGPMCECAIPCSCTRASCKHAHARERQRQHKLRDRDNTRETDSLLVHTRLSHTRTRARERETTQVAVVLDSKIK